MFGKSWKISNQTELNTVTVSEVNLIEPKPDRGNRQDVGIDWAILVIFLGWVLIFIKLLRMQMAIQKENAVRQSQSPLDKVPCKNCRFFSNNRHLSCAVQPSIVLTKEAVNCPDYCSLIQK